jgi:hypothetical protein
MIRYSLVNLSATSSPLSSSRCYGWQTLVDAITGRLPKNSITADAVEKHMEFFMIKAEVAEDAATAQSAHRTSTMLKGANRTASARYCPKRMLLTGYGGNARSDQHSTLWDQLLL